MTVPRLLPAATAVLLVVSRVCGHAPQRDARPASAAPPAAQKLAPEPARSVAITFDDLPGVAQGDRSVAAHARITDGVLRHVRAHRVPAIGFVNEDKLLTDGRVDARGWSSCAAGRGPGWSWGTTATRTWTSTPRPWTRTSPTWRAATA